MTVYQLTRPSERPTFLERWERRRRTAMNRTSARLRWLRDVEMGLVTVTTGREIVLALDGSVESSEIVWYPRHPEGQRATTWLCLASSLWTVSKHGTDWRRIAKLTREGKAWLTENTC